jgi:hypothetical protein
MIVLEQNANFADVRLSAHELTLIGSALNEICNGVDIADFEFQARVGVTRQEARNLLEAVDRLLG